MKRLRRWLAPAAVGALSVLLAVSVGVMVVQQREIGQLSAAYESVQERPSGQHHWRDSLGAGRYSHP